MNKVTILIPTYNERGNIIPLVKRLHHSLSNYNYKILFIDDNSENGTAKLASTLSPKYPVNAIVRKDKRGLASAVIDGLNHITEGTVVIMDADLQHPPEVIPDLLSKLNDGADIAIASRYIQGGGCEGWSLVRKIMSKGAILIAHILLPSTRGVKDPMSGFFAFNRLAVTNTDLKPTGYKILLELLVMGKFQNVVEVPYTFKTRSSGKSKLSVQQQLDYLKHIYSLIRRTGELLKFFKFCLVGISGIGVNQGLLYILHSYYAIHLPISSIISIESSIISNFTLNNIFTFRNQSVPGARRVMVRLLKFNLTCLVGLGINVGILLLLTNVFGIHYLISNLCGITIAFLWNYILSTWWTWSVPGTNK